MQARVEAVAGQGPTRQAKVTRLITAFIRTCNHTLDSNSSTEKICSGRPLARSGCKLLSMKTGIAPAVLLTMISLNCLGAQLPPVENQQDSENAAVKYLRADASLRQSYALDPDATAKLQKALESPLDSADEKLVAAAEEALLEFHHGATGKRCNWDMSVEDGPLANTAHRGAIMELVSVSGLRARLRFRDEDTPGAMSDALTAMAAFFAEPSSVV